MMQKKRRRPSDIESELSAKDLRQERIQRWKSALEPFLNVSHQDIVCSYLDWDPRAAAVSPMTYWSILTEDPKDIKWHAAVERAVTHVLIHAKRPSLFPLITSGYERGPHNGIEQSIYKLLLLCDTVRIAQSLILLKLSGQEHVLRCCASWLVMEYKDRVDKEDLCKWIKQLLETQYQQEALS